MKKLVLNSGVAIALLALTAPALAGDPAASEAERGPTLGHSSWGLGPLVHSDGKGSSFAGTWDGNTARIGVDLDAGVDLTYSDPSVGKISLSDGKRFINRSYLDSHARFELGDGIGIAGSIRGGAMLLPPKYRLQVSGESSLGGSKVSSTMTSGGLRPHVGIEPANFDFRASSVGSGKNYLSWHPEVSVGATLAAWPCAVLAAAHAGASLDTGFEDDNTHKAYGANFMVGCKDGSLSANVTRITASEPVDIANINAVVNLPDNPVAQTAGIRVEALRTSNSEKFLPFTGGSEKTDERRILVTAGGAF